MILASILAVVPPETSPPPPAAWGGLAVLAAGTLLTLRRRPSDDLSRAMRRLRVDDLQDAPDALRTFLHLRDLAPVEPWHIAMWLDGAPAREVRPALDALHLTGASGARVLLRLARGH